MSSKNTNQCRPGCAACCIVISISSPLPGMPEGKPAGVRCVNLDDENHCSIHDHANFPEVCSNFKFDIEFCGNKNEEAFEKLAELEILTQGKYAMHRVSTPFK
jgi:uncharacterized protein